MVERRAPLHHEYCFSLVPNRIEEPRRLNPRLHECDAVAVLGQAQEPFPSRGTIGWVQPHPPAPRLGEAIDGLGVAPVRILEGLRLAGARVQVEVPKGPDDLGRRDPVLSQPTVGPVGDRVTLLRFNPLM